MRRIQDGRPLLTLVGRGCGLFGLVLSMLPAAASGQQFARLASTVDDRSASARAGGAAVVVDRELLRSGPQRLELQATDGRILVAERSLFQDRGDGNAMWVGRFPEANYDSVVLTVQDGHVQGMFGEPGQAPHWLRVGRDGRGRLAQPVARGPGGGAAFCGAGPGPSSPAPVAAVDAQRLDPPTAVVSESNHDRLDILVLYTVAAAEAWEDSGYGTPRASVQAAMDFLNLVLRNNSMPAAASMVHLAEAPAALDGTAIALERLLLLREIADLRAAHQADLVHLFLHEEDLEGLCGLAYTLFRRHESAFARRHEALEVPSYVGWTQATCGVPAGEEALLWFAQVFAHEVGHNLGANHDPANSTTTPDDAFRPWAFGHFDIDVSPTVETIMSYRSYVPRQWVPFFSSTRIRPNGWTIGVRDERENERALYDSMPLAVLYSELMPDPAEFGEPTGGWGPPAPGSLTVRATGSTSVRLAWKDASDNESGFRIQGRTAEGIWRNLRAVDADETTAAVTGLNRGASYSFRVRAWHDAGGRDSDIVEVTLPSSEHPGPSGGNAPEDITAAAGATSVKLGWSGAAEGMVEVEARTWKNGWRQLAVADAAAGRVEVKGLDADTPYTFRLRRRDGDGRTSAWSEGISATTGGASGACRSGGRYLCLAAGRFEIQAHWKDHNRAGVRGQGTAVPIDVSDESGMFWFFTSTNIELVVKTLDGRGVNGHYWVFFGGLSDVEYWVTVRDTAAGGRRTYHNPPAEICGQSDTKAFVAPAAAAATARDAGPVGAPAFDLVPVSAGAFGLPLNPLAVASAEEGGDCEPGDARLCLRDGRFAVEVEFLDPNAKETGAGKVVASLTTAETGFFWFFSPTNVEVAAKVLDGRSLTGRHWFLYGGLSDVEYTVTVTDTVTGESKSYVNEAGSLCGQIDTGAL